MVIYRNNVKYRLFPSLNSFQRGGLDFLGFLTFLMLLLLTAPLATAQSTVQSTIQNSILQNNSPLPPLGLPSSFLLSSTHQPDLFRLLSTRKNYALPSGREIMLSGAIFSHKKQDFISDMTARVQYHERTELFGIGVTGKVTLPVLEHKSWSVSFTGTLSSSHHETLPLDQRNRWNLEYQIGGKASYHISSNWELSVGTYQYRLINHVQYENPQTAYTKSHGGFMTLQLHF